MFCKLAAEAVTSSVATFPSRVWTLFTVCITKLLNHDVCGKNSPTSFFFSSLWSFLAKQNLVKRLVNSAILLADDQPIWSTTYAMWISDVFSRLQEWSDISINIRDPPSVPLNNMATSLCAWESKGYPQMHPKCYPRQKYKMVGNNSPSKRAFFLTWGGTCDFWIWIWVKQTFPETNSWGAIDSHDMWSMASGVAGVLLFAVNLGRRLQRSRIWVVWMGFCGWNTDTEGK